MSDFFDRNSENKHAAHSRLFMYKTEAWNDIYVWFWDDGAISIERKPGERGALVFSKQDLDQLIKQRARSVKALRSSNARSG